MTESQACTTEKPSSGAPVWQDDSAAIPRERNLLVAWWIALVAAVAVVIIAVVFKPDPYAELLVFIGDGLVVTFQITIISMSLSLVLGLIAGLGRTSRIPAINVVASLYVEVIRGIPLLAQLFWIYYALARFVRLGPNVSAVVGLTVCYGAYIGETFRAGIQSIPKGQMEAARSLGLSRAQAMRYVIVPQAVRVVLPPVGNEFIAMLKDSSLVSVLAISDMLRRGREFASRTFAYFESYTLVALIYLLVTLVFSRVVFYIEQGMSRQGKGEPVSAMHRLAALAVDAVVLDLVGLVLYGTIQTVAVALGFEQFWVVVAIVVLGLAALYTLCFWTRTSRTPGMMAVGLRIESLGGHGLSLKQAVTRLLFAILPVPGFSLLWMRWSLARQPLHDQQAGTRVVRE